jgi:hypothetical protein
MPGVSFRLWIIVHPIGVKELWSACASNILGIRNYSSSIPPLTPAGSIRSKSTFRIVRRKVLTPNDIRDLDALAKHLLDFQCYWESTAKPFEWKFTRQDFKDLLAKFDQPISDGTVAV